MSNRNAYEIRHSLLVDASEMLFRSWERKCEVVFHNANASETPIEEGVMPESPSFEDILNLAKRMEAFVSANKA